MWELYVSQKPRLRSGSTRHPHLGKFPATTPLSYVVLATACMAPMACDRPSTVGVVESLTDLQDELASKLYTDFTGHTQACACLYFLFMESLRNICVSCMHAVAPAHACDTDVMFRNVSTHLVHH